MSFEEMQRSVARHEAAPPDLSPALQALWQAAGRDAGAWDRAHQCAQADSGADAAWVHAYLHRQEGDLENAAYWYRRAGKTPPPAGVTLGAEWEQIARALLRQRE